MTHGLCGVAMFITIAMLIFHGGSQWERGVILWALVIGAISQFISDVGENPGPTDNHILVIAWFMAWTAVIMMLIAAVGFTVGG